MKGIHLTIFFYRAGFKTHSLGPAVWRGGETEALERLNNHMDKKVSHLIWVYPGLT